MASSLQNLYNSDSFETGSSTSERPKPQTLPLSARIRKPAPTLSLSLLPDNKRCGHILTKAKNGGDPPDEFTDEQFMEDCHKRWPLVSDKKAPLVIQVRAFYNERKTRPHMGGVLDRKIKTFVASFEIRGNMDADGFYKRVRGEVSYKFGPYSKIPKLDVIQFNERIDYEYRILGINGTVLTHDVKEKLWKIYLQKCDKFGW